MSRVVKGIRWSRREKRRQAGLGTCKTWNMQDLVNLQELDFIFSGFFFYQTQKKIFFNCNMQHH